MQAFEKQMGQMNVETKQSSLKIDNIYDMLFDSQGNAKEEHMLDKLVFTSNQFDFLEQKGKNFETRKLATKAVDVD
jgi:hypothetical protein